MSVRLSRLGHVVGTELPAVDVRALTLDSRRVQPGDGFVAVPGLATDGRRFIRAAVAAGARVVLAEAPCDVQVAAPAVLVAIPGLSRRLGALADAFNGSPSAAMRLAGVTGTNGKTTVAWLVAAALSALGERCGYSGTLGRGEPGDLRDSGMTSVDVLTLHAWLGELRAAGCNAAALEVSSHALDQGRIDGVRLNAAVFTNLSRDHLDYHGDMARYGAAKARLFDVPGLELAVINIDDAFGASLAEPVRARAGVTVLTTSIEGSADVRAVDIDPSHGRLRFVVRMAGGRQSFDLPLQGRFNVHNALAVVAVLASWGHPLGAIAEVLSRDVEVPGRMQSFHACGRPLVVVDYAHTPDALARALEAMREAPRPPLVCVFGCGGDRDVGKRPLMGAVAERLADVVVLTDDNPRSEAPEAIVADIRSGMQRPRAALTVHDRRAAIATAIERAGPDGSVLVAGKGHERSQVYADRTLEFSDLDTVAQLMRDAA